MARFGHVFLSVSATFEIPLSSHHFEHAHACAAARNEQNEQKLATVFGPCSQHYVWPAGVGVGAVCVHFTPESWPQVVVALPPLAAPKTFVCFLSPVCLSYLPLTRTRQTKCRFGYRGGLWLEKGGGPSASLQTCIPLPEAQVLTGRRCKHLLRTCVRLIRTRVRLKGGRCTPPLRRACQPVPSLPPFNGAPTGLYRQKVPPNRLSNRRCPL